jgi:CHAT domain-containing protein
MISRRAVLSICFFVLWAASLSAQGPFEFREAFLLEHRMEGGSGLYAPTMAESTALSRPSLANQFIPDPDDIHVYQSNRWITIVSSIDKARDMGGIELVERHYLGVLAMLRKAQGDSSSDVSLMLDHIGEFYLEIRSFDKAYASFSEAVRVRRAAVDPKMDRRVARLHLADLLVRLGQLDLAKGDLAHANEELSEAVNICNDRELLVAVPGLYALYFESRVLEKQSKWAEAEQLWRNAITLRESVKQYACYWHALKEFAAFYARHEDFHAAAEIANQVNAGLGGKLPRPDADLPLDLNSRPRSEVQNGAYSLYRLDSDAAMSEILAIDKWHTDGPETASPLLKDLFDVSNATILDDGSDSEHSQLLNWFQQRIFLHMSILLDGTPSQQRIDTAYKLFCQLQGRYIASAEAVTRFYEHTRDFKNDYHARIPALDELANQRSMHAKAFVSSALDGKPYDLTQFALMENRERIASAKLTNDDHVKSMWYGFSIEQLNANIPSDTALLDYVSWERMDRDPKVPPHHEYGVFIVRHGQPVRYQKIAEADALNHTIDSLQAGVFKDHIRGGRPFEQAHAPSPKQTQETLKSLYRTTIAPLEPNLAGATKLWIIPDGKLAVAPMGAFIDGGEHYLVENRAITYMNSWRNVYAASSYDGDKTTPPVVVANPDFNATYGGVVQATTSFKRPQFTALPGAALEAEDVASAIHVPKDRVLTGSAARKWLIESVWAPQILHLATHSIPSLQWSAPAQTYHLFEFPQPLVAQNALLQSVIALAGANREQAGSEDGLLTGLEVASLHLYGTRLVVVSSCESAQGTPIDGQGVFGLRAAFEMAGADSLVMTLWPVDDQAGRQFMQFFYSHLSEKPAEALRLAQWDMIRKTKYTDPYYWSGYVLSGTSQTATRQTLSAPEITDETFVTPNCFRFVSHITPKPGDNSTLSDYETTWLRIGGVVRQLQSSPNKVIYEIGEIGNDVAEQGTQLGNNGARFDEEFDDTMWNRQKAQVTLTITKNNSESELELSLGFRDDKTDPPRILRFRGGPSAFPTLNVPESLPPLKSLTEATDFSGVAKIEEMGFCSSAP